MAAWGPATLTLRNRARCWFCVLSSLRSLLPLCSLRSLIATLLASLALLLCSLASCYISQRYSVLDVLLLYSLRSRLRLFARFARLLLARFARLAPQPMIFAT